MKLITIKANTEWSKITIFDVMNTFSKQSKTGFLGSFVTVVWDGKNNIFYTTFCAN